MNNNVTQLAVKYGLLDTKQSAIDIDIQRQKIERYTNYILDDILEKVHVYNLDYHDIDIRKSIDYIHHWIERKYRYNERS